MDLEKVLNGYPACKPPQNLIAFVFGQLLQNVISPWLQLVATYVWAALRVRFSMANDDYIKKASVGLKGAVNTSQAGRFRTVKCHKVNELENFRGILTCNVGRGDFEDLKTKASFI
ncbi:hypothetical protein RRG08_007031 [Elysia crispata]|uniref:Uncharacterized protein n=1 Tax=Elysia crispata TaxID=231223 RepID=A0AAE0ZIX0_9GAST|nr:hypothetical protein RRG08_007031 [Elysia crispata]